MKLSRSPNLRAQAGFTLVELMVSIAIGLLLVLAMLVLLTNISRSNSETAKTSKLIESGRAVMLLLETELQHSGYWGGFVPEFDDLMSTAAPADVPSAVPNPCAAFPADWTPAYRTNLVGIPIQAYEVPAVVPTPTIPDCGAVVANPKARTDVLVVRRAELAPTAFSTDHAFFQVERCGVNRPTPGFVLSHLSAELTLTQRDCATPAELRRFISHIYYVRDYASTVGDNIPTLVRSRFARAGLVYLHGSPEVLVEGIEGFRIEVGVDNISRTMAVVDYASAIAWQDPAMQQGAINRGDGTPDEFVRCLASTPCTVDQLMNAVSVKLHVLVRNETATAGYTDSKTYTLGGTTLGPFDDSFKRHLFTQTVRLVNPSSRREAL